MVRPETILAWHRKLVGLKYTAKRRINTSRQQRMEVIRELCVKFSEENTGWGYGRIQGALSNLGYEVSMTTFGNILRAKGIIPSPERGKQSNWKTFVRSHLDVIQTKVGCPQQNAFAESFVSSIMRECVDKMIFFGERPLRRAISQFVEHFHRVRKHQGIENVIPFPNAPQGGPDSGLIVKSEQLGGC